MDLLCLHRCAFHNILHCLWIGRRSRFFQVYDSSIVSYMGLLGSADARVEMERHCYILWMNFSGLVSTLAFVVLAVTSLHHNRRRMYRLFYLMHIPCAWIMLLGAIAHITYISLYLFPGILYYLVCTVPVWVDQFSDRNGYKLESIEEIPRSNGCYELRFPHDCPASSYGEVVKVCAPEISFVYHPFSVIRDPKNPRIMVCIIRGLGDFSKSLRRRLVDEPNRDESFDLVSHRESPPKLLLDGPYPAEYRWHTKSHTTMLLVAGGVGIVPFLPMLTNIRANPEDKVRRIVLHWYCREVGLAKHIVARYLHGYNLSVNSPDEIRSSSHENHQHNSFQQGYQEEDGLVVELFIHITSRSGESHAAVANEIRADEESDTPITHLRDIGTKVLTDPRVALQPFHTRKWPLFFAVSGLVSTCLALHWWYYKHAVQRQRTILPRIYSVLLVVLEILLANSIFLVVRRIGTTARPEASMPLASDSMEDEDESSEAPFDDDSRDYASVDSPLRVVRKMKIFCGRPSPTAVVSSVSESDDAGAFFCGPTALRTSIKRALIAEKRRTIGLCNRFHCSIYDEESEM